MKGEVFGGEGSLSVSSRPLQAGGCPQRDLLTYRDGGLLACGEQEVVSCLQVWGAADQVSGWPSDPAWSQASLLGFLPMQVGSQWAGDNFPCYPEYSCEGGVSLAGSGLSYLLCLPSGVISKCCLCNIPESKPIKHL